PGASRRDAPSDGKKIRGRSSRYGFHARFTPPRLPQQEVSHRLSRPGAEAHRSRVSRIRFSAALRTSRHRLPPTVEVPYSRTRFAEAAEPVRARLDVCETRARPRR